MKPLFLFLSLLMISVNVFAQQDFEPGYIIKNNGDTIYGKLYYQYDAEKCSFKADSSTKTVVYSPDQIHAYRFLKGKYYVSKVVPVKGKQQKIFIEYLVDGIVRLYYDPSGEYFIETMDHNLHVLENNEHTVSRNGEQYEVGDNQYIGILRFYLKDCPEIQKEIDKSKLETSSLIHVVTDYHHYMCSDKRCLIYVKPPHKFYYTLGIASGCNYNMIGLSYIAKLSQPNWALGWTGGVQLSVSNVDSLKEGYFTIGAYYSFVHHIYTDPISKMYGASPRDYRFNDMIFDVSYNYSFTHFKIKPFVGLGTTWFFTFLRKNARIRSYGPELISGVTLPVNNHSIIKLSARYCFCKESRKSSDVYNLGTTGNLSCLISLQFSLDRKKISNITYIQN